MHVIYSLAGETRWNWLTLLLHVQNERHEALEVCEGAVFAKVIAITALDEGFALDVENCNETGHEVRGRVHSGARSDGVSELGPWNPSWPRPSARDLLVEDGIQRSRACNFGRKALCGSLFCSTNENDDVGGC